MRILLVEDSDPLRDALRNGLQSLGYVVDTAAAGNAGLERALSGEYDLAILDVMLPELDGFEIVKRVRATGSKLHVLMLTAKDTVEDRVHGLDLGADDYLVKPFAVEELAARIRALGRRGRDRSADASMSSGPPIRPVPARSTRRMTAEIRASSSCFPNGFTR